MTTQTKTYFIGNDTDTIVCNDCAGYALKANIAKYPQHKSFDGAQEVFEILGDSDIAEMREEFNGVCNCELFN